MDIFTAVIFDKRSIVPDCTATFTTLKSAKGFVERSLGHEEGPHWEEWAEGKFVFGYGAEDVEEPIAAVYGSTLNQ